MCARPGLAAPPPCPQGAWCATAGLSAVTGQCAAGFFSKTGWSACEQCAAVPLVDIIFLSPPTQTVLRSMPFQMGMSSTYLLTDMCFRGTLVANLSFSVAQWLPPPAARERG